MNKYINKFLLYLPVSYVRGFKIDKYLSMLLKSEFFPIERIERIQLEKLNKILKYANENVPHYKNSLKDIYIKNIKDLSDIPFITKEILKKNPSSIKSRNIYKNLTKKTTAGSTGEPFVLWKSSDAMSQELAATWRGYSWAGIEIGDPQGRLWGMPLHFKDQLKAKAIDFVANRKRCSAFAFNTETLDKYTKELISFKPKYFYGYVSMIVEYANYFNKTNTSPPFDVKAIVTTSEILSESGRQLIEKTFKTKVYNEYGSGEVGTIAHECLQGSLHISAENMIVEILDNERVCKPGEVGEIVITELNNTAMPLIRYRTGDLGSLVESNCKCGRKLPIIEKLEGRAWDMIYHRDGRKFHPAFFLYIFEGAKEKNLGINHYKIIQEDYQRFKIIIVPDITYGEKSEQYIQNEIRDAFDVNTVVNFEYVQTIEREPSGKLRQMVGMNQQK